MDPDAPSLRRFPLVARPRLVCLPLPQRVADLCERARRAQRNSDLAEASAVHNQAALVAADCGLPEPARQWCRRQAALHLRGRPLDAQAARHALEPMTNLARLHICEGDGERAFRLMDTLFAAVSSHTDAVVDGVEIPAELTDSPQAHQEVRRWLWAVLLATGARGLAAAGRWADAHARLRAYNGIGHRMLDGRQVAVIAAAVSGDTRRARTLLGATIPGQPWENAVTACLTLMTRDDTDLADTDAALASYRALDASAPGLTVFHTRLGLSLIDAIGTADARPAHRIAGDLIDRAVASRDGYPARDVLAHAGCRRLLTEAQRRTMTDLVEACALGSGTLPTPLLADLTTALAGAEQVIAHRATRSRPCREHQRRPRPPRTTSLSGSTVGA